MWLRYRSRGRVKGIVFSLLEQVVSAEYGADTWDELLDAAGASGVYTSLGNYPDEELMKLVGAASVKLELEPDVVVSWFGRNAVPLFAESYPQFFDPHQDTQSFVLTLNGIIHPEVRKLYPGAIVPDFDFDTSSPEVLRMGYRSPRKLCAFAEGLIAGAADHYGEEAAIEQSECMKRGSDRCLLEIRFTKSG